MDSKREELDGRSPKRQAHDHTPCERAARGLAPLDDAIWTRIFEFLPMPKDLPTDNAKDYDAAVSEIVTTWRTLLNLRLVSKELAALLYPVDNAALWKRMLLQSFDFSVTEEGFNVENNKQEHKLEIPANEKDSYDSSSEEEGDVDRLSEGKSKETGRTQNELADEDPDPQLVAMRGRYFDTPPNCLEEDLVNWHKLGIYHRPSQYGFPTTLQEQPPVGVWPESEDPFTLFGDLVRLLMLPHGDGMLTNGEGRETMFKVLVAPTEAGSSSAYFRFYVMKTLGYAPDLWHFGRGIGEEWKGVTDPEAFDQGLESNDCHCEIVNIGKYNN